MQTEEALERVAYEQAADLSKDGVVYFETRFAPIFHTKKGLTHQQVVSAVLKGLERGRKDYGIGSGLIICAMRNLDGAAGRWRNWRYSLFSPSRISWRTSSWNESRSRICWAIACAPTLDGLTVEDYYSWPISKRREYCATRSDYGKALVSQDEALVARDFDGSWDSLEGAREKEIRQLLRCPPAE